MATPNQRFLLFESCGLGKHSGATWQDFRMGSELVHELRDRSSE